MASLFYKRYIPPPIKIGESSGTMPSVKKRKLTRKSSATGNIVHSPHKGEQTGRSKLLTKEERKNEVSHEDVKHMSILAKYNSNVEPRQTTRGEAAQQDQSVEEQKHERIDTSHDLEPIPQPIEVPEAPKVSISSALPIWLQSPVTVNATATKSFSELPINGEIVSRLKSEGYESALAIQTALLPMLLSGPQHYVGDICVSAKTGSGKTLAYALPMVESIRNQHPRSLRGLIVVPTKALVLQVNKVLELCSAETDLVIGTAVGSKSLKEEQASLVLKDQNYDPIAAKAEEEKIVDEEEELMDWDLDKRFGPKDSFTLYHNHVVDYKSMVDILVCTPGRLVEHINSTAGFTLAHVEWLVIDEADQLLDDDFQQWVDTVLPGLENLPAMNAFEEHLSNIFHTLRRREVRKVILSATMTKDVSKLISLKLRRPRLVVLESQQSQGGVGEDGDVTMTEACERFELPDTLKEFGLKVSDINDKPLFVISLLSRIEQDLTAQVGTADDDDDDPSDDPNNGCSTAEDTATSNESERELPCSPVSRIANMPSPQHVSCSNMHGTLIFTKSNEHASRLARLISLIKPAWSSRIGTMTKSGSSANEQKTLKRFQQRKISILIASDRASRGLDILDLAHVINYDVPSSVHSYVHRVGRTARAGKGGMTTTLLAENEARWFWNEIARNPGIGRAEKVRRDNSTFEFSEEDRVAYQEALSVLGEEAMGGIKRRGKGP